MSVLLCVWLFFVFLNCIQVMPSCGHPKVAIRRNCTRIFSHIDSRLLQPIGKRKNSMVHHVDLSIANLPRHTRQRIWCLTLQPAKSDSVGFSRIQSDSGCRTPPLLGGFSKRIFEISHNYERIPNLKSDSVGFWRMRLDSVLVG